MSASPKFYIGDPKLVARLKQYLDDNGKCDVDSMIEHLQNTYSEYRRKKVNSLKSSVEKVRLMLLESQSSEELGHACSHCQRAGRPRTDESTEENSFSSDGEYVETQDQNRMNSLVTSLYKSTSSGTSTPQPARSTVSSAAASPRPSSKHTCVDGSLPFFIDKVGDRLASSNGNLIPSVKQHHRLGFIKKGLPEAYSSLSVDSPLSTRTVVDSDHPVSTVLQPQSVSCQSEKRMADDRYVASCKRPKKFKPSSSPPSATSSPAKQPVGSPAPGDRAAVVDVGSGESAVATTRSTPHATKRQNKAHQAGLGDKPKSGAKPRAAPKEVQYSNVRFADVGGNDETMLKICKMLVHMKHPEVYSQIGITPPRGFLLHGPPGCGKTLLAQAIAGLQQTLEMKLYECHKYAPQQASSIYRDLPRFDKLGYKSRMMQRSELQLPLIKVAATEMVSGVSGESEERLRDLFDQAVDAAPSVLFIDEIDAITPKRETASKDMERRMVAQLLSCMDDLSSKSAAPVLVIGATNRPDSLDAALRRAGRFDHEICLGIPGEAARRRILEVLCRILKLHESCDLGELARLTPGFVGADLMALTRDAAMVAIERSLNMMQTQSSVVGKSNLSDLQTQLREHPISQQDTATADAAAAGTSRPSQADSSCSNETTASVKPLVVAPAPTIIADPLAVVTPHELSPDSSPGGSALPPMASHGAASGHSTDVLQSALQSVLSWLKECPPLSSEQLQSFCILPDDFKQALEHLQPSAKREGFATVPDVTWADIGALHSVREELQMAVLAPIKYPQYFQMLGLTSPSGILLAGPPGCGKTLLAKAIANESGINFISVKGPELLNMYVGESERAVRQVFQRARNSVPCVIFFDELDALCPRRSDSGEGGSSVRVVNQLLTEMDGLEARKQVFILGATNRPDIIDPAILRPGRLDKVLFVDLPTSEERLDILRTITKCGRPALAPDVSLHDVAAAAQDFTGADLSALVRETSLAALKELMTSVSSLTNAAAAPELAVRKEHFDIAFSKVKPSVSAKDRAIYSTLRLSLSRQ